MPARGSHEAASTKLTSGGRVVHVEHPEVPLVARKSVNGNHRPMRFVSLHHHSTFSYLDGYQLPEAHVRRAQELQMPAMAMTEHGNMDSHVKFEASTVGTGVKPIFGCEVYTAMGREPTQRKFHLTLIAKDQEGYINLLHLVTQSWRDFYYEPTVTWESLVQHKRGLICLSGCQGSMLACSTVGGKGIEPSEASYDRGLRVAKAFRREFGDHYFVEVQAFPELEATRAFAEQAPRIARAIGARLVATMDCHYTALAESEVQQILHNLRPGEKRTLEEQARDWGYEAPLCPPPNDRSIYRRLVASGLRREEAIQAIVSTEEITQSCNVILPKLDMPRFPLPDGFTNAIDYWRHLLKEGWKRRGLDKLPADRREVYKTQLKHEMDLIERKDFVDYHLLVQAGIVYAKDRGVPVGPGRGSSAASIACWLLRITEVDPLRPEFLGLLNFSRYIDVTRVDLPDIDIDVPVEARPMVRAFYERLLGPGCVNNVGTFVQFKGKNSLDDIARVFNVPRFEVERVKDFLIERSSGDLRASSTVEDTVEQFPQAAEVFERHPVLKKASLLEGNYKNIGVHAAGLVLSNQPISNVTTMMEREVPKGSGNIIQCIPLDKEDSERQGLLKIDYLALDTMSMLWKCLEWTDMSLDDLYNLPLDDPGVYDLFQRNDVIGVFTFDGKATRYVNATLKPETFAEIMDAIAVARPGPLHNGAAREYAEIKQGRKQPEAKHPALEPFLGATKYQIVYQEQILNIVRDIGGFDVVGVADIRKIIARKKGEQAFAASKAQFIEGALSAHRRLPGIEPIPLEVAESTWGSMITSGAYAFNAAHCASYAMISVHSSWFKVYHPEVFYAAALYVTDDTNKPKKFALLRDAFKHDINVRPPDARLSSIRWKPTGKLGSRTGVRAGLQQINGVGPKQAASIVEYRNSPLMSARYKSSFGWDDLTAIRGIGPKTVEKIETALAQKDWSGAFKLSRDITSVKEQLSQGELGPLPIPTHNAIELPLESGRTFPVIWLGTLLARNVRDIFEINRAKFGTELDASTVKDPHLNEWCQLTAEDESDQLLLRIDRWHWPAMKIPVFDFRLGVDLLLVEGVRPKYTSSRQIRVKRCWVIDPE